MFTSRMRHQGRVANPRPVAKIKTGRVCQPITDAAYATGRDRSWIATRPSFELATANDTINKQKELTLIRKLSLSVSV